MAVVYIPIEGLSLFSTFVLNLKFDILQCSCRSQAVMAGTITCPVREKPALTESGGIGKGGGRIPFGREMRSSFYDENFVNLIMVTFEIPPTAILKFFI